MYEVDYAFFLPWPDLATDWIESAAHQIAPVLGLASVTFRHGGTGELVVEFGIPQAVAQHHREQCPVDLEGLGRDGTLPVEVIFRCNRTQPRRALIGRCSFESLGTRAGNGRAPDAHLAVMRGFADVFGITPGDRTIDSPAATMPVAVDDPLNRLFEEHADGDLFDSFEQLSARVPAWFWTACGSAGDLDAAIRRAWPRVTDPSFLLDLARSWVAPATIEACVASIVELTVHEAGWASPGCQQAFVAIGKRNAGAISEDAFAAETQSVVDAVDSGDADALQMAVETYDASTMTEFRHESGAIHSLVNTLPLCVEALVRADCAARLASDVRGPLVSLAQARRDTMKRLAERILPMLPVPTARQLFGPSS